MVIPRAQPFGDPKPGNHRYLFVDLASAEEAERAAKSVNGKRMWGVKIRVELAKMPESCKLHEREDWELQQHGLPYD